MNNTCKINRSYYIFYYDVFKRLLISLPYILSVSIGFLLILFENWFTVVFGYIIVFIMSSKLLDIVLFKRLAIGGKYLIKEWFLLGRKYIFIKDLKVNVSKKLWSGIIFFHTKDSSFLERFIMSFETFPVSNVGFKEIREILISKNIITGDEHEWND